MDGRVGSASTTTGADGTSSNTYFVSAPLTLLTPFLQGTVTASAMGSSVTFTETNGATASQGIAQISSNLQSPIPGITLTGSPGSISSIPVGSRYPPFSRAGRYRSGDQGGIGSDFSRHGILLSGQRADQLLRSSAHVTCVFGNTIGEGKIKIHVGNNYDVYGPIHIQVGSGPGTPPVTTPGTPGTQLECDSFLSLLCLSRTTHPDSFRCQCRWSVTYSAAVQVSIAQVSWLTVGTPSGAASNTAPSTFSVTVVPQGLQAGTYRAQCRDSSERRNRGRDYSGHTDRPIGDRPHGSHRAGKSSGPGSIERHSILAYVAVSGAGLANGSSPVRPGR